MRRSLVVVLSLLACGPAVPVEDDGGGTGDGSTTMPVTSVGTLSSTSTASTTVGTTASDAVTSIDPSTSGADESSEVDSGSFFSFPDLCFTHCSVECDPWAQDCPRGDKCMPWANDGGDEWNAVRCVPIDPRPAAIGQPCLVEGAGVSGLDDCGLSAMCWGVDPATLEGVCVAFCGGSEANPVCDEGLACFRGFEGTINLCLPACDPLGSDCAPDEACTQYFYSGSFEPTDPFACVPTPPFEPQPYGAPCGILQVCDAGHVCVQPEHVPGCEDLGCCTTVGEVSQMPVCPDVTQSCIPFDETMPDSGPCYCGVAS